ncbi:MAG: glycine zipper family protein [Geobacteraceae bacterium]|nr:glycine zipper family protein [Geobacteraceae bacterium]
MKIDSRFWRIMVSAAGIVVMATLLTVFSTTGVAAAQDPYVYPTRGQSSNQVEQDKYSCYQWAKGQTGFDPMQTPTATAPPPPTRGGAVRGAAGGAALGAAVGAIAGDAGKGAAIGAASGGIIGGVRRHRSKVEQNQYAQEQAAGYEQRRTEYNRAWGACMEGKGYTVK